MFGAAVCPQHLTQEAAFKRIMHIIVSSVCCWISPDARACAHTSHHSQNRYTSSVEKRRDSGQFSTLQRSTTRTETYHTSSSHALSLAQFMAVCSQDHCLSGRQTALPRPSHLVSLIEYGHIPGIGKSCVYGQTQRCHATVARTNQLNTSASGQTTHNQLSPGGFECCALLMSP